MNTNDYYAAGSKAGLKAAKANPTFYYELKDWAANLAQEIDDTALTQVTDVRMDYIERGSGANGFDSGTKIDELMREIQGSLATVITQLKSFSKLIGSTSDR